MNYSLTHHASRGRVESSGEVELISVDALDEDGAVAESILSGGALRVRVRFKLRDALRGVELIVGTHSTDFVYLSAGSTAALDMRPDLSVGLHEVEYLIPFFPLVAGVYCIRFSIFDQNRRAVFIGETLKTFKVIANTDEIKEPGSRILHIPAKWRLDGMACDRPSTGIHA